MKAVTIAAAGAAVIGSVSAASHVKHMHAKVHANVARDSWVDWNETSTSTTTSESVVDSTTTSTTAPVATSTTAWEDWDTSIEATSTSSSSAVSVETWGDWTATSSDVEEPATTRTETWGDWAVTSYIVEVSASTSTETATWGDWSNTEAEPSSTATETWGDWSESVVTKTTTIWETPATSSSETAASETATETWGDWTSEGTTTVTLASTVTNTKYIQPLTTASTEPVTSVITSTIVPAWPSSSSSAPAWTVDSDSCAISVYTSYGLPTWYPTPIAFQANTTTSSGIWGDWAATTTSTTPAAVTSTSTSSAAAVTWGDWTSTSSEPAAVTSSTETWGDWTSTSSEPAVVTSSTETWGDWAVTSIEPTAVASSTETWGDWAVTSIEPAVVTSSTETWGDWTSTTTEPAAVSTSTETWADWASVSTESATVSTSTEGGSWGGSVTTGSASSTASGSQPKSSGGSTGITTNGNSWALTYSPYTAQGGCKEASTVAADLAIIAGKGFTSVRVYSTDCSTLENIGTAARDNGLKLILGVWISSSGISGAQGQVEDIVAWAQWDLVELIVVGNEAVFNGYASASELAAFVSSCSASFKGAGYTGLITLTEPLSVWQDTSSSSAFCSVVDVVGANLYAFFNADVSADKAGGFIQSEIDILNNICSGKAVYVLESGWPNAGECNGAACPGVQNQATALKGIQATVGAQVVFLSYEDEPWKEPGQFDVEQHWGCASVF